MSSEASLVFYGIRFEITPDDIPSVEDRTHPTVSKGRSAGLQFYWEDFGVDEPTYYGFIGRRIAILGVENDLEISIGLQQFTDIADYVQQKLIAAGIEGSPSLYLQWMPEK